MRALFVLIHSAVSLGGRMSIVSPAEIRLIPERYCIGKRPLSLLLGWGELTYTRILDGNTPNTAHSAELRRLLDDPAAFARLLNIGKARITEAAYARSMNSVEELLKDQGGSVRATRIFVVADRICSLSAGDLTPSALQRLVYYAQGFSLAKTDSQLFDDLPRAASSGPEYQRIAACYTPYEIEASYTRTLSEDSAVTAVDAEVLSAHEIAAIDYAFKLYGDYSGQALSRMSCSETPWRKARKRADVASEADCNEIITAKSMKKYFLKQIS